MFLFCTSPSQIAAEILPGPLTPALLVEPIESQKEWNGRERPQMGEAGEANGPVDDQAEFHLEVDDEKSGMPGRLHVGLLAGEIYSLHF